MTGKSADVTGRDGYLIAKALHIAIRAMRASKHPAWSDIEDMERLLREYSPGLAATLESMDLIRQATAYGFQFPKDGASDDELRTFIASRASTAVLPFRKRDNEAGSDA
jgi:hypothetical protein